MAQVAQLVVRRWAEAVLTNSNMAFSQHPKRVSSIAPLMPRRTWRDAKGAIGAQRPLPVVDGERNGAADNEKDLSMRVALSLQGVRQRDVALPYTSDVAAPSYNGVRPRRFLPSPPALFEHHNAGSVVRPVQ